MKLLALGAIRLYQKFLSPHKGFCCAYAAVSGRASCSVLGYRVIRRHGIWNGLALLDRRL
ncbi:MAG: membrane protein insertion efficiency factor YidD, partial [Gammaproteobacteria bacterium]